MNFFVLAQGGEAQTAWELLRQGGPMVWVLLLVSAFAVTAFLERVLNYRRVQINTTEFIAGIRTNLKNNYNIVELVAICDATPGPVARMTRSSVLEVLKLDHVRTARAKGLTETQVILRHGLRNALIPVVTLIGLQAGYLLGGAVVTETIFSWPGIGRLTVGAILSSDFTVAQGAILVFALAFIIINLIVDVLYSLLDPRVRR